MKNNKMIIYHETLFSKIVKKIKTFFQREKINENEDIHEDIQNIDKSNFKSKMKIKLHFDITEMNKIKTAIEQNTLSIDDLSTKQINELKDYYQMLIKNNT